MKQKKTNIKKTPRKKQEFFPKESRNPIPHLRYTNSTTSGKLTTKKKANIKAKKREEEKRNIRAPQKAIQALKKINLMKQVGLFEILRMLQGFQELLSLTILEDLKTPILLSCI